MPDRPCCATASTPAARPSRVLSCCSISCRSTMRSRSAARRRRSRCRGRSTASRRPRGSSSPATAACHRSRAARGPVQPVSPPRLRWKWPSGPPSRSRWPYGAASTGSRARVCRSSPTPARSAAACGEPRLLAAGRAGDPGGRAAAGAGLGRVGQAPTPRRGAARYPAGLVHCGARRRASGRASTCAAPSSKAGLARERRAPSARSRAVAPILSHAGWQALGFACTRRLFLDTAAGDLRRDAVLAPLGRVRRSAAEISNRFHLAPDVAAQLAGRERPQRAALRPDLHWPRWAPARRFAGAMRPGRRAWLVRRRATRGRDPGGLPGRPRHAEGRRQSALAALAGRGVALNSSASPPCGTPKVAFGPRMRASVPAVSVNAALPVL